MLDLGQLTHFRHQHLEPFVRLTINLPNEAAVDAEGRLHDCVSGGGATEVQESKSRAGKRRHLKYLIVAAPMYAKSSRSIRRYRAQQIHLVCPHRGAGNTDTLDI